MRGYGLRRCAPALPYRGRGGNRKARLRAKGSKQSAITSPLVTKAKIVSHEHMTHREAINKHGTRPCFRVTVCERFVKGQEHEEIDAKGL